MDDNLLPSFPAVQPEAAVPAPAPKPVVNIKIFGVGNAGVRVLDLLIGGGIPATACVAANTEAASLAESAAAEKFGLEAAGLRGSSTGTDPQPGGAMAVEQAARLKSLCGGAEVVFVVAGLGGGTGTGFSPVLACAAKEAGALALAFVTTPFDCEGSRRHSLAQQGLEELKAVADGIVCLPNQKAARLIDEDTSVIETFRRTNELLADGVRGIWRLLRHPGLIEIHFAELCTLLREQHSENAFAVAEALGPTRSREVVDKLLAHPLLDEGRVLSDSDAVLISLMGGPDLTMAEVNRVMEQLNAKCGQAQVIMGAAIDEAFRERLAVTLIAARKDLDGPGRGIARRGHAEELDAQLLSRTTTVRPGSRFVPPPPVLTPEKMQQMLARQAAAGSRARKAPPKLRQTQLPLEIISKGRFDKSEPTIHKGEDLDVPTYIRRGVALN